MSDQGDFDEDTSKRNYTAPYTSKHPIPTIQKYRAHRTELDEQQEQAEQAQHDETDDSKLKRAFNSVKKIVKDDDSVSKPPGEPYPSANFNHEHEHAPQPPPKDTGNETDRSPELPPKGSPPKKNGNKSQSQDKSSSVRKDDGKAKQTAGEKVCPLLFMYPLHMLSFLQRA
jgi:hypothetical protein